MEKLDIDRNYIWLGNNKWKMEEDLRELVVVGLYIGPFFRVQTHLQFATNKGFVQTALRTDYALLST